MSSDTTMTNNIVLDLFLNTLKYLVNNVKQVDDIILHMHNVNELSWADVKRITETCICFDEGSKIREVIKCVQSRGHTGLQAFINALRATNQLGIIKYIQDELNDLPSLEDQVRDVKDLFQLTWVYLVNNVKHVDKIMSYLSIAGKLTQEDIDKMNTFHQPKEKFAEVLFHIYVQGPEGLLMFTNALWYTDQLDIIEYMRNEYNHKIHGVNRYNKKRVDRHIPQLTV